MFVFFCCYFYFPIFAQLQQVSSFHERKHCFSACCNILRVKNTHKHKHIWNECYIFLEILFQLFIDCLWSGKHEKYEQFLCKLSYDTCVVLSKSVRFVQEESFNVKQFTYIENIVFVKMRACFQTLKKLHKGLSTHDLMGRNRKKRNGFFYFKWNNQTKMYKKKHFNFGQQIFWFDKKSRDWFPYDKNTVIRDVVAFVDIKRDPALSSVPLQRVRDGNHQISQYQ